MKYNKQYRFTVFTEDATVDVNRFRWKLNMGSVLEQDADYLMSIESITTEVSGGGVINMEMCCIRCENVMSKYSWCIKDGSPVIFCGNPMAFCFLEALSYFAEILWHLQTHQKSFLHMKSIETLSLATLHYMTNLV